MNQRQQLFIFVFVFLAGGPEIDVTLLVPKKKDPLADLDPADLAKFNAEIEQLQLRNRNGAASGGT